LDHIYNLAVQIWRGLVVATNPPIEVVIAGMKDDFEIVELFTVELGQNGSGKVSENKIKLADSTVSTAKKKPFAPRHLVFLTAHPFLFLYLMHALLSGYACWRHYLRI
jgi:hypothetical protein